MKGLLLKEFYLVAKHCRALLLIAVVFLGISFAGDENIFFIVYPTLITSMIPMTLISYDERDRWTQYSAVLPYSREQLVSAKYLIGLLFTVLMALFTILALMLKMVLLSAISLYEIGIVGIVLLVMGLIGPTFLLPFVFRFGVEKGRILYYVMIVLICACGAAAATAGDQVQLPSQKWMFAVAILAVILLYVLSWYLSVRVYQKREL